MSAVAGSGGRALTALVWAIVLAAGAAGAAAWAWMAAPEIICSDSCVNLDRVRLGVLPEASIVLDAEGGEIGRFALEHRRTVRVNDLPTWVHDAFLAIEDRRFYEHGGLDWRRMIGAARANLRAGGVRQGSSTITMQLARNLYPDELPASERSLERKLREMAVARRIEQRVEKHVIIERYLNTIYLGAGAYGVEAAARTYFGHGADSLSLAEAATLAALPKAPSALDPRRHPEAARRRRDLVIGEMIELGWIDAARGRAAMAEPVRVVAPRTTGADRDTVAGSGAWYVREARRQLAAPFGDALLAGGLRIHTTMRPQVQAAAESALERGLERLGDAGAQGAVVVVDPATGAVEAMVGGRDDPEARFNRVTQARRQPGSAFKPFVYAAAIDAGWRAHHRVSDAPLSVQMGDGTVWTPRSSSESAQGEGAWMTLRTAFAWSKNRAAVRLALATGLEAVGSLSRRAGVPAPERPAPSLALGASEVTPLELAGGYTVFARDDGAAVRPFVVSRVTDAHGRVLWEPDRRPVPVTGRETALRVRHLMERVVDGGTGSRVRSAGWRGAAAGKTGTTNDATDLWFVGLVPGRLAVVWMGADQPRPLQRGRATGGVLAVPVWADLFAQLHPDGGRELAWAPDSVDAVERDLLRWAAGTADGGTIDLDDLGAWDEREGGAEGEADSLGVAEPEPAVEAEPAVGDTTRLCIRPWRAGDSTARPRTALVPCHLLRRGDGD